jgi:DNA polymerase III delta subunit
MKDYPLYLLLRDAQRFPMKRLSDLMEAVLETEIMMKSSKLGNKSPQILLEHLVIKFSAN